MTRRASVAAPSEPVSIRITLPWTPDGRMSPNSKYSDRTRKKLRKESKNLSTLLSRTALTANPHWQERYADHVYVVLTFRWEAYRKAQDRDNLISQAKGILDGLQDGGVIANDKQICSIVVNQERDPEKRGETIMEVVTVLKEDAAMSRAADRSQDGGENHETN